MNNKMISSMIILCSLLNFAACNQPKTVDFFPFDNGAIKEYIVTYSCEDNKSLSKIKCINLALRNLDGKDVLPVKLEPYNMSGILIEGVSFYFYRKDDNGVFEYAKQNPKDCEPIILKSLYYIMKYPIRINNSWIVDKVKLSIDGINETITVPSGTFDGCIKIKSIADNGDKKISWYAPNIGLIKYITNKGNTVYNGQLSHYNKK